MIRISIYLFLLTFTCNAIAITTHAAPFDGMVTVGDHQLQILCTGAGSPTVLLEAGSGSDLTSWSKIQPEVAKFTRVCSYSRAGLGESTLPVNTIQLDAAKTAADLHQLLISKDIAANSPGPYVLVGHSFGGIYIRNYLDQHPHDVAGMVLVEANPGNLSMKDFGFSDDLMDALMIVEEKTSLYIADHPDTAEEQLKSAPYNNPALITSIKNQPLPINFIPNIKTIRAIENEDMAKLLKMTNRDPTPLQNTPLIVIIAGKNDTIQFINNYRDLKDYVSAVIDDSEKSEFNEMLNLDVETPFLLATIEKMKMLSLSTSSQLVTAANSGHNVQLEQPQVVIDGIKTLIHSYVSNTHANV